MRVLHFVSIPSRGSGVMSVIMNYYRHIDRDKVQFDFLCFIPCADSYEEEIKSLGGIVYYIPKPGLTGGALKELKEFLGKNGHRYSWFHNHEVYLSFLLYPLAKRFGIPHFIVHSHATRYSDRPMGAIRNRILCLPLKFMKCERFACSKAAGRFLYGNRRMENEEVFILHNAIACEKFRFDPEKRERIREKLGLEGKFVIGHVGRFERQKNHEFLIEIFAECKKQRKESLLMLIGEGSLRPKIEMQVKELGLEASVIFLGQRDDIVELYQGMDVFVLPSLYEGFPVSCIEAQANGLRSIVANTITKEIENSEVFFLPLEQREKWAELICSTSAWYLRNNIKIRSDCSVKNIGYLLTKKQCIEQRADKLISKYFED